MSELMKPETYLDKKLEPMAELTEKEEEKQLQDIRAILTNFPSVPENEPRPKEAGEYQLGDFSVSFNFRELNPTDFCLNETKESLLDKLFGSESLSKEEQGKLRSAMFIGEYKSDSPNRARQLSEFSFKKINSDETINLSALLPDKHEVIYMPDNEENGVFDSAAGKIFLKGDITSLDTILVLLHEIGHAKIFSEWNDEERTIFMRLKERCDETMIAGGGGASNEEIAWFYKVERDAWAFAISQIKKIFPSQIERKRYAPVMQAIDAFIHEYTLRKNSDIMRKALNPNFKGLLAEIMEKKGITEEEFDRKIDEFLKKSHENDSNDSGESRT